MRRVLPVVLLASLLAAAPAHADPRASIGADFPIFFGADPKLMFGWGYFLEITVPGQAMHSFRIGGESFGMGDPPARANASDWMISYRYYRRPRPDSRLLPFFGVGLGTYSGGAERDASGRETPGTDFGGKLGLSGEIGAELMFTSGLRGVGLRLSVNGVLHPDAQWVTFPMALLFWYL